MPEPNIVVHEYIASFVWHEIDIDLLKCDTGDNRHKKFYSDKVAYSSLMAQLLNQDPAVADLKLPWTNYKRDRFWRDYLSSEPLLSPRLLTRMLSPAFVRLPISLEATSSDTTVTYQAFAYPFGIVVAVNVKVSYEAGLSDVVEDVHSLLGRTVGMSSKGSTKSGVALGTAGRSLLAEVRRSIMGDAAASKRPYTPPVSIVTITGASGSDINVNPEDNDGYIHRRIWALTRSDKNWKTAALRPLDKSGRTKTDAASPNWLIFQSDLGNQAIWCPDLLPSDGSISKSLTCYHRNLVTDAVQFGSLTRFLDQCAAVLERDKVADYREFLSFCAVRSTDIVRRACLPWDHNIRHSASTSAAITGNPGLKASIDLVRGCFGRE